jgi:hypothetical protein
MAASGSTISQILKVLERHMPDQEATRALIVDLYKNVTGNKSVMETLERLEEATR